MDNQTFNDAIIAHAAQRMMEEGYASSVEEAVEWLKNRQAEPAFTPENSSFAAQGAVKTLGRLCTHAYNILRFRRYGEEIELSDRVKAYYLPIFEKAQV